MNNTTLTRILTILQIALLILCIAAFVLLCIYGQNASLLTKKQSPTSQSAPSSLKETLDYGEGYLRSIVFISDKTMSPIVGAIDTIQQDQVWTGIEGTLTLDRGLATASVLIPSEQGELPIPDAAERIKPQFIVITVGLENGVNHCTEEKFKEYYSNLILKLKSSSPDSRIILQSIFPVSKSAEKSDPSISNERIDAANSYIADLAKDLSLRYLDTCSVLKDKGGKLDPRYDSGDGITLNQEGFEKVVEYIRTHGYN